MPVTSAMITELKNALMKDQAVSNPSFRVSNFKRQGASADFNRQAMEKNAAYSRIRYEGQPFHLLFQQASEAYSQLQTTAVDIDFALGEHAWLAPYLPLFNSQILQRLLEKHRAEYLYTDESEICLQSIIVLMLAHHSNPHLFTENPAQFEVLANDWLETILTFNEVKNPELRSQIDGWHDNPFCSIERNLKFMQFCAEAYYKVSKNTVDMQNNIVVIMPHVANNPEIISKITLWSNRMIAFAEVNKVLFKVLRESEKLNSHVFVDAVRRVQYVHQNQSEFTFTEAIASVASTTTAEEHKHDISVPIATAISYPQHEPEIVIASTEEEEGMRRAGMQLFQSGLSLLNTLTDPIQPPTNTENSVSPLIDKANKIIASIHELINAYPVATSYEKRGDFVSKLYLIPQKFNPILSLLTTKQEEMNIAQKAVFDTLDTRFREAMSEAVTHAELVRRPPRRFTEEPRKQMMDMIRKDDATNLQSFIHNMSSPNSLDDLNYVLRNAAHFGAINCLKVLCGPFPNNPVVDIFSEGNISKKIAMHSAIESGHANCVAVLLNTMNNCGGRAPVAQLMHGVSPNRPIDSLKNLACNARCLAICDTILAHNLNDFYSDSNAQKLELRQIVRQLKQERTEATLSANMSSK